MWLKTWSYTLKKNKVKLKGRLLIQKIKTLEIVQSMKISTSIKKSKSLRSKSDRLRSQSTTQGKKISERGNKKKIRLTEKKIPQQHARGCLLILFY